MILGDNFLNLHESIKSMKNRLKGKYKEILNLIRKVFFLKKKKSTPMFCGFYITNVEVKHVTKIAQKLGGKNLKCKIFTLYRK